MSTRTDERNRQQRRHGTTGTPMTETKQLQMQYGHNGTHIVMMMTAKVDNLTLTPQQVDDMIDGLKVAKEKLIEHRAAAARTGAPGNA